MHDLIILFACFSRFAGAFIQGNGVLSWAANNTKKFGLQQQNGEGPECCESAVPLVFPLF